MTPRAKKGPRTLAGFRGGNGGEPNKETIHRAPTDGKPFPYDLNTIAAAVLALFTIPALLLVLILEAAR
jgi:hypothetical protein